jgi:hypothetical protein
MRTLPVEFFALAVALSTQFAAAASITIDPTQNQVAISPYVYGANQVDGSTVKYTSRRLGGNRLTGYNWENNYSNAGSDWNQSNDTYLCDVPAQCSTPAATITQFVDASKAAGAYPLVTLQMAGYVSADKDGSVTAAQVAPSSRWKRVVNVKGSPFTLTPDPNDDSVYMDELVNFLVAKYGNGSSGGVTGYDLDNEPDIWALTHPLLHPQAVGAVELVNRSVALSGAIKSVDPSAEVFGFVSYGYSGYVKLQDAPDWSSVKGNYDWFVEYFLASMAAASQTAGKRLLDVIDLHYYSEATGNGTRVQSGTTENAGARVQATRSLWDASYGYSANDPTAGESSWITQWNDPIELIPRVERTIAANYPGTKFAISEYDFGAADHISGGIAEADALGLFGKYGVYFATRWGSPGTFTDAAYRLFLDYDGQGSHFGDVGVEAATSDVVNVPAYAAIERAHPNILHVVLINRNLTGTESAAVSITGASTYQSGHAYGFDSSSSALSDRGAVALTSNGFSLDLPALTAVHVVLATDQAPAIDVPDPSGSTPVAARNTPVAGANGCGCRLASAHRQAFPMWALIGACLVIWRRRRCD